MWLLQVSGQLWVLNLQQSSFRKKILYFSKKVLFLTFEKGVEVVWTHGYGFTSFEWGVALRSITKGCHESFVNRKIFWVPLVHIFVFLSSKHVRNHKLLKDVKDPFIFKLLLLYLKCHSRFTTLPMKCYYSYMIERNPIFEHPFYFDFFFIYLVKISYKFNS